MKLVRLQISGFLSYNQKVSVDFTDFDLACISGANGAGKSTLLEAITWVLFGEARRKDDAIINQRANTAEVILDFDYENNRYQVQRSKTREKSTLLEFRILDPDGRWRAMTEATMRSTEELIRRSLHLDYDTFINASFFLQGKADQFAQQKAGDRKRILSGILGLDIWEEYRDEANRRRRGLEAEIAIIDASLAEIESELAQEGQRKAQLAALEKDLKLKSSLVQARKTALDQTRVVAAGVAEKRKAVEKQAAELGRLREELDNRRFDLETRQNEQQTYQAQMADEERVRREVQDWEAARSSLQEWDALAANFHQYDARRQAPLLIIEKARAGLLQEQHMLQQQAAEKNALAAGLPALAGQVEALHKNVEELNRKIFTRADIEAERNRLQDVKAQARAENTRLRDEMNEVKERINALEKIEGAACPTCEKPLDTAERQKLIADLNTRGTARGNAFRENQQLMVNCDEQIQQVEASLAELLRMESELKTQQRSHDLQAEELRKNRQDLEGWAAGGQKRLEEVTAILSANAFAEEARAELGRIDDKLKELGYDPIAHGQVRLREQEGRSSQQQLLALENAKAALVPLEREIKDLQKSVARDEKRLEEMRSEYEAAAAGLQKETAGLPDIDQLEREYFQEQEEMNQTISQVGYCRNQVDVLEVQRRNKAARTEEKQDLLARVTNLKILERTFGKDGIPALLIEQALPDIESHANDVLDRLSSGGMSVKFETQRDYKDKNREGRKETLDILIRDSSGERPYEMFSGGEAFRVNFAIRLALSRVLAQRAGARLQTLVIDEGFGSQDADGRQRLIEAINLVRSDFAKVLVITHLEELKDAFSARIEVTKPPGGSQVQVVAI